MTPRLLAFAGVLAAQAAAQSAPSTVSAPVGRVANYVDVEGGLGYSTNPYVTLGKGSGQAFVRGSVRAVHTRVSARTSTTLSAFGEDTAYPRHFGSQKLLLLNAHHDAAVTERLPRPHRSWPCVARRARPPPRADRGGRQCRRWEAASRCAKSRCRTASLAHSERVGHSLGFFRYGEREAATGSPPSLQSVSGLLKLDLVVNCLAALVMTGAALVLTSASAAVSLLLARRKRLQLGLLC